MKKEDLKLIRQLRAELCDIDARIDRLKTTDAVRGSDDFFPYISRMMTVSGTSTVDEKLVRKLRGQRKAVRRKLTKLLGYIDDIDDGFVKKIFIYRYEQGQSWNKIAQRLGMSSADQVRKVHDRHLKK